MAKPVLNTALVLEEPQQIDDGGGGYRTVWVPLGTLWAEVRSTSARERTVGERPVSQVSHKITIRTAPVDSPRRPHPAYRFRLGERVFTIRGISEQSPRSAYLTCWATEEGYL